MPKIIQIHLNQNHKDPAIAKHHLQKWQQGDQCFSQTISMVLMNMQRFQINFLTNNVKLFKIAQKR